MIVQADASLLPIPDNSVHLIVTSPPYNLGKDYGTRRDDRTYHEYLDWLSYCTLEMYRVLVDGGRVCINIPLDINLQFDTNGRKQSNKQPFYHHLLWRIINRYIPGSTTTGVPGVYNTTVVWLEGNTSRMSAWGSWMSPSDPWINTAAEMILVLSKGTRKRKLPYTYQHDIYQREFLQWVKGLWTFPGESSKRIGHPAPYPVELPYRCIRLFSMVGDTVLDPFMGSGTTGVAAKHTNREFIGVDINPEYCTMAEKRIDSEVWVRTLQ
jgi:site-specific DNA-methyltransferase (adenine-specific)